MPINGFNKTTLLDYPGKIAATIFLGSCNFRCPFCHNSGLVLSPGEQPVIPTEDVLKVLKKRQGILEGGLHHRRRTHPGQRYLLPYRQDKGAWLPGQAGYQRLSSLDPEKTDQQ